MFIIHHARSTLMSSSPFCPHLLPMNSLFRAMDYKCRAAKTNYKYKFITYSYLVAPTILFCCIIPFLSPLSYSFFYNSLPFSAHPAGFPSVSALAFKQILLFVTEQTNKFRKKLFIFCTINC